MKAGLKLRRRKINARVETVIEETSNFGAIASLRAGQIGHWTGGEKEAKHRADPMKTSRPPPFCLTIRALPASSCAPSVLELFPTVDPVQFA